MSEFLTVKEATKVAGKSESTIKRLLREITSNETHPDRNRILPSHTEVKARRSAGEPYIWKIDEALVRKRYPEATKGEQNVSSTSAEGVASGESIISVLREQLLSKDRQIQTLEKQLDRKDGQIGNQNDRMREQNILMKDLQERLAISAPANSTTVVDASQAYEATNKPAKPNKKSKTSVWRRQFHLFGGGRK